MSREQSGSSSLELFTVLSAVLLFTRKMYPVYLGLVIPLIGLIIALIKFGVPELVSLETALHLIDIVVIVCCAILIMKQKKLA